MQNITPRDYQVHEILEEVDNIKNFDNKVEHLQTKFSDHTPLLRILKMNFCDTIVSMLPEGTPPFNREPTDGPNISSLWAYTQVFPVIVRSAQSVKMKALQIEKIFIEMLEAVDVKEADTICLAKDKKLQEVYPSVTIDLIKKAFPSLNISSANYVEPEVTLTDEERAVRMLDEAKELKAKAKDLNAKARELTSEAKKLAAEV